MNDIQKSVIEFIAKETGVKVSRISLASSINCDFGIDGDDAREIMAKFSREFNVDMTGFSYQRYFGSEAAFNPLCLLLPSWWRRRQSLRPLRVEFLVASAETKQWRSDAIQI